MKCGGYESLLLLEDYYLWLKMVASGCILGNINETLVYVRIGNGFHSKRGSKIRINGWKFLQKYMLEHNMITKREAFINMIYIRAFTYLQYRDNDFDNDIIRIGRAIANAEKGRTGYIDKIL